MSAETDPQLWERVLGGDSRAFGLIFDRHRDRVFRHVRRSAINGSDAEDLTATVFLELWRRRTHARIVDDSLLPWLLVTAANTARNATRARNRYRRFLAALPQPEHQHDHAGDVAHELDLQPQVQALLAAIATLPATDRSLIVLTALEGLSLEHASGAVGISYGAAKTRLSRLRRRLGATLIAQQGASS